MEVGPPERVDEEGAQHGRQLGERRVVPEEPRAAAVHFPRRAAELGVRIVGYVHPRPFREVHVPGHGAARDDGRDDDVVADGELVGDAVRLLVERVQPPHRAAHRREVIARLARESNHDVHDARDAVLHRAVGRGHQRVGLRPPH